jgi:hypothetical protein
MAMKGSGYHLNCTMLHKLRISLILLALPVYTHAQISIGTGAAIESPFLMSKAAGGYNHYSAVPAGCSTVYFTR